MFKKAGSFDCPLFFTTTTMNEETKAYDIQEYIALFKEDMKKLLESKEKAVAFLEKAGIYKDGKLNEECR